MSLSCPRKPPNRRFQPRATVAESPAAWCDREWSQSLGYS